MSKDQLCAQALASLRAKGVTFGYLAEYFFRPTRADNDGFNRWHGFFRNQQRVVRILTWWLGPSNSPVARKYLREWMYTTVAAWMKREVAEATKKQVFQLEALNKATIENFGLSTLYSTLSKIAPITTHVFEAISQSDRQEKDGIPESRKPKKQMAVVSAALSCFSQFNVFNNVFKRMMGIYLYATGAQRQLISVVSRLGLSDSYSTLSATRKPNSKPDSPPGQGEGTLRQLSNAMRTEAQEVAATVTYGTVYDNINFTEHAATQTLGRKGTTVESGTAATIFPLWNTKKEDLDIDSVNTSFNNASPLLLTDILHTPDEAQFFKQCLVHCILRIIVNHGGPGFAKFKSSLHNTLPKTDLAIDVHQTPLHPLPTWKIDESTIVGNAQVDDAIVKELHLRNQPTTWMKYARILAGDQLSVARLRTIASVRAGHETAYESFSWGIWMPGLFHCKIADAHGTLLNHWGKGNTGTRNPGSLAFENTLLHRLPLTPHTTLPSFRISRDLIFLSLYARVLHCLLLVSGHPDLATYLDRVSTWDELYDHAEAIYAKYANTEEVSDMRARRRDAKEAAAKGEAELEPGDMVFENAVLFFRDALISREFTDSVKIGDSGRVLAVLKIWALSFRGNGRSKYAHEMLHIIHNIARVWPKPVVSIILNNWLLNPSGRENSFVEVDLVQEHSNGWIKVFYKARGSNASWEWLEMISPCIQIFRNVAHVMKHNFGTQNGSRHAQTDHSRDIKVLMDSLSRHEVYTIKEGRVLDGDEKVVVDVIQTGLQSLLGGNGPNRGPLAEFNEAFKNLQKRRRGTPVEEMKEDLPANGALEATTPPTPPPPPPPIPAETDALDEELEREIEGIDIEMDAVPEYDDMEEEATLVLEAVEDLDLEMDLDAFGGRDEDGDEEMEES